MCDAVYEVLATLVEAGVQNTAKGMPLLKRKKGELVKGDETEV